ncbi:hypothetical protein ASPZODRAFT_153255 [Penicilliopsis zonata CBS 506.65]|uniref:Major facilitator superfamily (MFS) profile domain-containing protein n=1 Tax=Penicilliopsis zonata CBS 506.65 TaxID=1073090 RepID=A0A1L9SCR6_9EURO|nr:hypothetical protein ASPZODRAFT_153255 [Penicilliopsis zonata CBS 506.65]OJJ44918.1 hypothetical protein ASPZODRAFT_153255 [Penicilliopsis zonata CBS 506.65]
MQIGNLYTISAIAVLGGSLFGFDISSMSAIISTEAYLCYFNQGDTTFDSLGNRQCAGPRSTVQGGITASMAGGSCIGALVSGYLSDWLGRKRSIMVGSVIWCIGSIVICAAQNIPMLVVGRVVNGFSVGICSAQVPVYISELAPPTKRGRVVGLQQWAITWGIMIMFYVSYACSYIQGPASFRLPWALQMIPGILLFLGLTVLPESPRWLARKDRWNECLAVLTLVHGNGDLASPFVRREFDEIRGIAAFERRNADVSFLELFRPDMIHRTHVGIFTQIWSQLTGINVMMYYITYVFAMTGLQGHTLLVSSSIQYILNVVCTIPALLWVDRWGRRPTLLLGSAGMLIFMFANGGLMAADGSSAPRGGMDGLAPASWQISSRSASTGIITCTYLFVACFAVSWGPVSWIYPAELFPLRVRGKANALTTSFNWLFNFALGYFVPPAFVHVHWRLFLLFGVLCAVMLLHVFLMFPETAGRTLEEVEGIFTDPKGVKYIGTPAWRTRNAFYHSAFLEGSK